MATQRVSSTSLTTVAYGVETDYGVIPAVKGKKLRITGESLAQTIEKSQSEEIDASRQTRGMFLTNASVAGNLDAELSAQEFDTLFEAALLSSWSAFGTNGTSAAANFTVDPVTKKITYTAAPTGANALTQLKPGQFISLGGASTTKKNQKPVRVTAVTATEITYSGAELVAQTGLATISTGALTNGVNRKSLTLEKFFAEKGLYYVYSGMQLNQFTLSVTAREAVKISFEFLGKDAEQKSVASFTTPYTESLDHPIIDSILGMKDVLFNGQPITSMGSAGVKSFELTFSNNMEGQEGIGVLGNVDVMLGDVSCTVSMEIYADDGNFYAAALAQTRFEVAAALYDSNGKGYAFRMPSVEFTSNQPQAASKNQALTFTLEGTALMDPAERQTLFIYRY